MDIFVKDNAFLVFLLAEITVIVFGREASREYFLDGCISFYTFVCGVVTTLAGIVLIATTITHLLSPYYIPNFIILGLGVAALTQYVQDSIYPCLMWLRNTRDNLFK